MPYGDLVNEVLERAVAPDRTASTTIWPQTETGDADLVRLRPDHSTPRRTSVLKGAAQPLARSFDLWAAETDAYLSLLGADRAAIADVLDADDLVATGDPDHASLRLGITPADRSTIGLHDDLAEACRELAGAMPRSASSIC